MAPIIDMCGVDHAEPCGFLPMSLSTSGEGPLFMALALMPMHSMNGVYTSSRALVYGVKESENVHPK